MPYQQYYSTRILEYYNAKENHLASQPDVKKVMVVVVQLVSSLALLLELDNKKVFSTTMVL